MSVPKLRFLEFQDALEWEQARFVEIAEILQGYGFPEKYQGKFDGEYPFYKVSDISISLEQGEYFIDKANNYISKDTLKQLKAKIIPVGTTIFAKIGEAIRSNRRAITTKPCLIDNNVAGIKRIEGKSIDIFIYYLLSQINLGEYASGVVPAVNKSAIENILIQIPSLLEQQKIADCLTSLESVITAQSQKLEALGVHKRGLMQQLFPSEGETVPKLRFLEFQDAGDWEIQLLGQLVKRVTTGKLDANAMVENGTYRFYTCAKNYYQIDKYAFDGESILIAGNGAYLGYIHYYTGKFNAYQRTYVLQDFDLGALFLKYYLDKHFPARILTEKKEGNTPYIVMATITEAPIAFPSLLEQQKIADCLTTLEQLITAQKQKLEMLRSHKKGLMQQLFPAPDEAQA